MSIREVWGLHDGPVSVGGESVFDPVAEIRRPGGEVEHVKAEPELHAGGIDVFLPGEQKIRVPFRAIRSLTSNAQRGWLRVKDEQVTIKLDADQAEGIDELVVGRNKRLDPGDLPVLIINTGRDAVARDSQADDRVKAAWVAIGSGEVITRSHEDASSLSLCWDFENPNDAPADEGGDGLSEPRVINHESGKDYGRALMSINGSRSDAVFSTASGKPDESRGDVWITVTDRFLIFDWESAPRTVVPTHLLVKVRGSAARSETGSTNEAVLLTFNIGSNWDLYAVRFWPVEAEGGPQIGEIPQRLTRTVANWWLAYDKASPKVREYAEKVLRDECTEHREDDERDYVETRLLPTKGEDD